MLIYKHLLSVENDFDVDLANEVKDGWAPHGGITTSISPKDDWVVSKKNWVISLLLILILTSASTAKDLLSPRIAAREPTQEPAPWDYYLGFKASKGMDSTRVYWGNIKGVYEQERGELYWQYLIDLNRSLGNFVLNINTSYKEARDLDTQSASIMNRWKYFGLGIGLTTKRYTRDRATYSLHTWVPLYNGDLTIVISEKYQPYWNYSSKYYFDENEIWFLEVGGYYGDRHYTEIVFGADIEI